MSAWNVEETPDLTTDIGLTLRSLALGQAEENARLYGTPEDVTFQAAEYDSALYVREGVYLIGYVILREWGEENILWIGMAHVAEAYRRKGIYRALLDAATKKAAAAGRAGIGLGVNPKNTVSVAVHNALLTPVRIDYQRQVNHG